MSVTPATGTACFATGNDSPVSADSSTSHPRASRRRQSAGTMSPAFSSRTSPRTSWARSRGTTRPPRRTSTRVVMARSNLSIDVSARTRSTPPMRALVVVTPATSPASATDPTAAASPAPTASTGVSGLASGPRRGGTTLAAILPTAARRAGVPPRRPEPSTRRAEPTEHGVGHHGVPSDLGDRRRRRVPAECRRRCRSRPLCHQRQGSPAQATHRAALKAGPNSDHAAPEAAMAERVTLRLLTARAAGRDSTTRWTSASRAT